MARIGSPAAASHAYGRRQPNYGCNSQATDDVLPDEDDAATDKADTRDDLRGNARGVQDDPVVFEDVREAVLRYEHDEGGGEADERISPQTGALLSDLAFEADQRREDEGQAQFAQLQPSLAYRLTDHGVPSWILRT
jgi:hypothetical protein